MTGRAKGGGKGIERCQKHATNELAQKVKCNKQKQNDKNKRLVPPFQRGDRKGEQGTHESKRRGRNVVKLTKRNLLWTPEHTGRS